MELCEEVEPYYLALTSRMVTQLVKHGDPESCGNAKTISDYMGIVDNYKLWISAGRDERARGKFSLPKAKSTSFSGSLSLQESVFVFLLVMRCTHQTWDELSRAWAIHTDTLRRSFLRSLLACGFCLEHEISFPSKTEQQGMFGLIPWLPKVVGYIDGTRLRVCDTKGDSTALTSGKINASSFNIIVVCDVFGKIIHVTAGAYGRTHDMTIFHQTLGPHLRTLLAKGAYLVGDPGFVGAEYNNSIVANAPASKIAKVSVRSASAPHPGLSTDWVAPASPSTGSGPES